MNTRPAEPRKEKRGAKISFSDLSNPWQRYRSQTGVSQATLAQELGISQVAISGYERRIRKPLPRIAQAFVALAAARKVRMTWEEIYD